MTSEGLISTKRTILCVDDEVRGLSVRKMILEFKGYEVFTAETGEAALKIFQERQLDLVVLDYMMPGMNGGRIAELMKKSKPEVPILMLSAYLDLPREVIAQVNAYSTKGESPEEFLGLISRMLAPRPMQAARSATSN